MREDVNVGARRPSYDSTWGGGARTAACPCGLRAWKRVWARWLMCIYFEGGCAPQQVRPRLKLPRTPPLH